MEIKAGVCTIDDTIAEPKTCSAVFFLTTTHHHSLKREKYYHTYQPTQRQESDTYENHTEAAKCRILVKLRTAFGLN
jgi:hypothetical protein